MLVSFLAALSISCSVLLLSAQSQEFMGAPESKSEGVFLKGVVQKYEKKKSGKAGLRSGSGKEDRQREDELQASLTKSEAELAEDKETTISWDKWRNRVSRFIWARFCRNLRGGDAFLIGNLVFKVGSAVEPVFPLGTRASYSCTISSGAGGEQKLAYKISKSSGIKAFDDMVLKSLRELSGRSLLRFPEGTKRKEMTLSASLFTTRNGKFQETNFGDIERVKEQSP